MAEPTFSIILPTYRHGRLLHNAIHSILRQSRQDFEVFLVCDGASAEGLEVARAYAASDKRFKLREHAKGPGHGEFYRDEAIREANGPLICYLGDDDFWLKQHLQVMADALQDSDLSYSKRFRAAPGGYFNIAVETAAGQPVERLDDPDYREKCLRRNNVASVAQLSATAHRKEAYLALPEGWTPRLPDTISYASMWIKFIADDSIRIKPLDRVTSVVLPSNLRHGAGTSIEEIKTFRYQETRDWMTVLESRYLRDALDYAATLPEPLAPREVCLGHITEGFKDRQGTAQHLVDGHLEDIARAYFESGPSVAKRLGLLGAMRRLRSLNLLRPES